MSHSQLLINRGVVGRLSALNQQYSSHLDVWRVRRPVRHAPTDDVVLDEQQSSPHDSLRRPAPPTPAFSDGSRRASVYTSRIRRQLRALRNHQITIPALAQRVARRLRSSVFLLRARFTGSGLRSLDWIWAGTDVTSISPEFVGAHTRIRYLHTWDYDLILRTASLIESRPSAPVYLDAMGPLHPDFKVLSYEVEVSANDWFGLIDAFLTQIEERLGQAVIIAAHPRALVGSLDQLYRGRRVLYGQTASLIASASVVLVSNPTTSLGMVALYGKPAVALRMPNLWHGFWLEMNEYVGQMGLELLDAGSIPESWVPKNVDSDAYSKFIQCYVKRRDTPDDPFWEAVRRDLLGT